MTGKRSPARRISRSGGFRSGTDWLERTPKSGPTNGRSRRREPRARAPAPPACRKRKTSMDLLAQQPMAPVRRGSRRLQLALSLVFMFMSLQGLSLRADVCDPTKLAGPYGFQLSGETTISGESKPVSNVGRMALAGDGGISGYSTAMFAGYLLGNQIG